MQKFFRTLVLGLTGLIVLAAAALVFFVATFDPNQYTGQITAAVKKATGRELRFQDPLEVALFPKPGIKTGRALLLDDPAFGAAPLCSVESASLSIALEPLFDGLLAIEDIALSGVRLKLVRLADGRGNWEAAPASPPREPEPGVTPLPPPGEQPVSVADSGTASPSRRFEARIDRITVKELAADYRDEKSGAAYSAVLDGLELSDVRPGADIPLRIAGTFRDDRGALKAGVELDALVRFEAKLLSAVVRSLHLEVEGLADDRLLCDGAAAIRYETEGRRLAVNDLSAALALAPQRLALKGDLVWQDAAEGGRALLNGDLRLDDADIDAWLARLSSPAPAQDNTASGGAAKGAPNMTRPKVAGSGQAASSGQNAPAPDAKGHNAAGPAAPPRPALPDLDLRLAASSLTIEGLPLREVQAAPRLSDGKADIPCSFSIFDGSAEARLKADLSLKPVPVSLVFAIKGLDLGKATARGGSYSVTGPLDVSLDVTGQGSDIQSVLHSLKGKASAKAGAGEIRGFTLIPKDLRGLNPVPVNFPYTNMSASAVIKDGTATSRDISLVSKVLMGRGGGIVRLAFKQLDIGVDFLLAGLPPAVPVSISGPFNSLSTSVDMRTFMRNVAEAGVKAPEEAAKGVLKGVGDLLFKR